MTKSAAPVKQAMPEGVKARAERQPIRLSDPRSKRSQELLRQALLRLIETRPFEKVTLRDITAEAGVSYPTFFNHYASKEDLFRDVSRPQITALLAAFRTNVAEPDWRPGVEICAHVLKHRLVWSVLLTAGAVEAMRGEFIRRGRDLVGSRARLEHGFPYDLISGVLASGIFEILSWWLNQEDEVAIGTVADMLDTLVVEPALGLPRGYFTSRSGSASAA